MPKFTVKWFCSFFNNPTMTGPVAIQLTIQELKVAETTFLFT